MTEDKQILRAQWHDYREAGFYMLTMHVEVRSAMPFGMVTGESENTATVALTPLGEQLTTAINDIPHYYQDIDVIDKVVMPDHCHILISVRTRMAKHLGNVVRALKSVTTKAYLKALDAKEGGYHLLNRDLSQAKRNRIRHTDTNSVKGSTSALNNTANNDAPILVPPLWAEGYHDRIVTRHGQITKLRQYIHRNPARLWMKQHSDHSLMAVRNLRIPIPLHLAIAMKQQAEYWDQHRGKVQTVTSHRHDGIQYADTYTALTQHFLRKTITDNAVQPFLSVRACGNIALLYSGRPLVSVRISRSVPREQLQTELHNLLDRCEKEGAILISPFISWSEKEVLKAARANNYPHIIISGEAMSMLHKPSDATRTIDSQYTPEWYRHNPIVNIPTPRSDLDCTATAQMLTIALWPDRPKSEKTSKPDCEIMNTLCRLLSDIE